MMRITLLALSVTGEQVQLCKEAEQWGEKCRDKDGKECTKENWCRDYDEETKGCEKGEFENKCPEFHVSNAVYKEEDIPNITREFAKKEFGYSVAVWSATDCQTFCAKIGCGGWSFDDASDDKDKTCKFIREEVWNRPLVYKKGGSVGAGNCTIEVSPSECIVSNAVYKEEATTLRKVNSITDCWDKCKQLKLKQPKYGCVGWSFDDKDKTCKIIREAALDRSLVYKKGGSVGTVDCAPPESTPCPPDDAPAKHTCTCTAETLTGKCKNNEICREYASTDITLCTEDSKDIPGVDDEESSDTTLTQCLQKYKTARLGHWQHTKYNDCKKINNTYPSYCGYYPEVKKCCPDTCAV